MGWREDLERALKPDDEVERERQALEIRERERQHNEARVRMHKTATFLQNLMLGDSVEVKKSFDGSMAGLAMPDGSRFEVRLVDVTTVVVVDDAPPEPFTTEPDALGPKVVEWVLKHGIKRRR